MPVPVWVNPPSYVAPPPTNIIYNNIHNTVVVNNTTNMVTITNPSGQTQTVTSRGGGGSAAGNRSGGCSTIGTRTAGVYSIATRCNDKDAFGWGSSRRCCGCGCCRGSRKFFNGACTTTFSGKKKLPRSKVKLRPQAGQSPQFLHNCNPPRLRVASLLFNRGNHKA